MHFTAAGSGKGSADYFSKREVSWNENGVQKTAKVQASAHLVIDRDGTVYQCVNFSDRAWHAGPATLWQGKPIARNANDFTIGIEIANWGKLKCVGPNAFVNYLGKPFTGTVFFDAAGDAWEAYPDAQLAAVIQAAKVVVHACPGIDRANVQGHAEIQTNKSDPGPAFPMAKFLDAVFGGEEEHTDLLNACEDDDRSGMSLA
jgi:N-acetylmuramoyl-L-alanine amidase